MTARRSLLLFTSATALTLALHEKALSESPSAATTVTTEPTTVESPLPGPTPKIEKTFTADASTPTSPKTTPPAPPEQEAAAPTPKSGTFRYRAKDVTSKERGARWEQRFRNMRERAMKRRQEILEVAERWDSYWKTLDAMTPKQKEAVHAIFSPGQRRCSCRAGRQRPPGMPMQPRTGQLEFGFPTGPGFPGSGYGYGPQSAPPHPFDLVGPTPFPSGKRPLPPGSAQPGNRRN